MNVLDIKLSKKAHSNLGKMRQILVELVTSQSNNTFPIMKK